MPEDLSWIDRPPKIDNLEEAERAQQILSRESGVPRGHESLQQLKLVHREEFSPAPAQLDDQQAWFINGLAYCMMGLDRSLFELFSHGLHAAVPVVTYRTDAPLALFDGVDVSQNQWFYTIQGISPDQARDFVDYIETFRFDDPRRTVSWHLAVHTIRIADPFYVEGGMRRGVYARLVLPGCITTKRRVVVRVPPGLTLNTPVLALEQADDGWPDD